MRLHPLAVALLLTGFVSSAHATDLLEAYELARQSDPQLSAAESQKNAQGEGVIQARSALLPQISADASYSKSDSKSTGSRAFGSVVQQPSINKSESTDTSYGVSIRQSIYDHGDYARLKASKARAAGGEADYDAASDALMVRLASAYFDVLTGIETLASARAEERSVKRQLDQAEKRLEVGLAPITDAHEARARYDSARANTILQSNALDDGYEALAEITGQPLRNLRGLATTFKPENADARSIEEWVKTALNSNPSLKSRELALEAAEKDVAAAQAAHYPNLSASASWRDNSSNGSNRILQPPPTAINPFDNGSTGTTLGLQLNIPIFSGFATQSRVRQAVNQRDATADQLEQQKRAITRQTRSAYRSLEAGKAEVEARRLAVVSAKAAYEAGEAGLEVGTRTIVDVLIAQQGLFQAQREFARSRHAFLVNELRLRQAAGILEVSDMQNVNRYLTVDAEAVLDKTQ
jgi:outer membrane protein